MISSGSSSSSISVNNKQEDKRRYLKNKQTTKCIVDGCYNDRIVFSNAKGGCYEHGGLNQVFKMFMKDIRKFTSEKKLVEKNRLLASQVAAAATASSNNSETHITSSTEQLKEITEQDLMNMYLSQDGRCSYCNVVMDVTYNTQTLEKDEMDAKKKIESIKYFNGSVVVAHGCADDDDVSTSSSANTNTTSYYRNYIDKHQQETQRSYFLKSIELGYVYKLSTVMKIIRINDDMSAKYTNNIVLGCKWCYTMRSHFEHSDFLKMLPIVFNNKIGKSMPFIEDHRQLYHTTSKWCYPVYKNAQSRQAYKMKIAGLSKKNSQSSADDVAVASSTTTKASVVDNIQQWSQNHIIQQLIDQKGCCYDSGIPFCLCSGARYSETNNIVTKIECPFGVACDYDYDVPEYEMSFDEFFFLPSTSKLCCNFMYHSKRIFSVIKSPLPSHIVKREILFPRMKDVFYKTNIAGSDGNNDSARTMMSATNYYESDMERIREKLTSFKISLVGLLQCEKNTDCAERSRYINRVNFLNMNRHNINPKIHDIDFIKSGKTYIFDNILTTNTKRKNFEQFCDDDLLRMKHDHCQDTASESYDRDTVLSIYNQVILPKIDVIANKIKSDHERIKFLITNKLLLSSDNNNMIRPNSVVAPITLPNSSNTYVQLKSLKTQIILLDSRKRRRENSIKKELDLLPYTEESKRARFEEEEVIYTVNNSDKMEESSDDDEDNNSCDEILDILNAIIPSNDNNHRECSDRSIYNINKNNHVEIEYSVNLFTSFVEHENKIEIERLDCYFSKKENVLKRNNNGINKDNVVYIEERINDEIVLCNQKSVFYGKEKYCYCKMHGGINRIFQVMVTKNNTTRFSINIRNMNDTLFSMSKKCDSEEVENCTYENITSREDIDNAIKQNKKKFSEDRRLYNESIANLNVLMNAHDVNELYIKQLGLCFYCKCSIRIEKGSKNRMDLLSIDRVDSSIGYHKNNIVLSCRLCNFTKSNMCTDDYFFVLNVLFNSDRYLRDKAAEELSETVDNYFANVKDGVDDDETSLLSASQQINEVDSDSFKSIKIYNIYNIPGHEMVDKNDYINFCWYNHKVSTAKRWKPECILAMAHKQKMRCAITGIPFCICSKPNCPFKPSVDRIDSTIQSHLIKTNCHLILSCLNIMKRNFTIKRLLEELNKRYISFNTEGITLNTIERLQKQKSIPINIRETLDFFKKYHDLNLLAERLKRYNSLIQVEPGESCESYIRKSLFYPKRFEPFFKKYINLIITRQSTYEPMWSPSKSGIVYINAIKKIIYNIAYDIYNDDKMSSACCRYCDSDELSLIKSKIIGVISKICIQHFEYYVDNIKYM